MFSKAGTMSWSPVMGTDLFTPIDPLKAGPKSSESEIPWFPWTLVANLTKRVDEMTSSDQDLICWENSSENDLVLASNFFVGTLNSKGRSKGLRGSSQPARTSLAYKQRLSDPRSHDSLLWEA